MVGSDICLSFLKWPLSWGTCSFRGGYCFTYLCSGFKIYRIFQNVKRWTPTKTPEQWSNQHPGWLDFLYGDEILLTWKGLFHRPLEIRMPQPFLTNQDDSWFMSPGWVYVSTFVTERIKTWAMQKTWLVGLYRGLYYPTILYGDCSKTIIINQPV